MNVYKNFLLYLGILTVAHLTLCDTETSARLLVSKQILNKYLVEQNDLLVRYIIYNVGNGVATNITINERGFHPDAFDVVGGQLVASIWRLAPRANYTYVLVVRPKSYGYFNFSAAEVTYRPYEEAQELKLSISSEPGEGGIVNLGEFNKRFSSHFLDWVAFTIMALPSLIIPFALWMSSKRKYERLGKIKRH